MKSKIKVALLINDYMLDSFNSEVVNNINKSKKAEITLIIKKVKKIKKQKAKPLYKRIFRLNLSQIIKFFLNRLLNRYFNKRYNLLFEKIKIEKLDLTKSNSRAKFMEISPRETKFRDYIDEEDTKLIKDHKVDVIFRIGFRIISGEVLNAAKYGIWSYHHGDNDIYRGSAPGFWEVFQKKEKTGAILQLINENLDAGSLISKTFIRTEHQSFIRNYENILFKSSSMVSEALDKIYNYGEENFLADLKKQNQTFNIYTNKLYLKPNLMDFITLFMRDLRNRLYNRFSKRNPYSWQIIYSFSDISNLEFRKFKFLKPNKNTFWADPFVVFYKKKYFVFFEEFNYNDQKGHISFIEICHSGKKGKSKIAIKKKYHLSYPYIFKHNNDYFMIPESNKNGTIDIYKSNNFPENWTLEKTIFNGINAHDTSIVYFDGYWWIFTNLCTNKWTSPNDDLYLFYSKNIFSNNWTSHPMNPIISDVETARGAGKIFTKNGKLYRPSQNNLKRYGYGLNINEIEEININNYKERRISKLTPGWDNNIKGMHTFNFTNGIVVSDVYKSL